MDFPTPFIPYLAETFDNSGMKAAAIFLVQKYLQIIRFLIKHSRLLQKGPRTLGIIKNSF